MNYREARQIEGGPNAGKWHYTNMNDGKVWADGACGDGCAGHDTAEEAYEHERRRLLRGALIVALSPETRVYSPGCCEAKNCADPATHEVQLPHPRRIGSLRLCDKHATHEQITALVTCGPSTSSW